MFLVVGLLDTGEIGLPQTAAVVGVDTEDPVEPFEKESAVQKQGGGAAAGPGVWAGGTTSPKQ